MIQYEGAALFFIISIGSALLIRFIWKDHQKNERLQLFFSVFTHDIKTSISRLRLQSEVLAEDLTHTNNTQLDRLKNDLSRLDLQLENSLLLTHQMNQTALFEKIKLSQIISAIKNDFQDLHIELNTDAHILTDKKWMTCVLRNIFQNAISHGKADLIKIEIQPATRKNYLELKLSDNGLGLKSNHNMNIDKLGQEILKTSLVQSNGIGLYLTRLLLSRLNSTIHFSSQEGFHVTINLPGNRVGEIL
jgi:signal transduction histidine kinase